MANSSEVTFGNKVANASSLLTHLQSFTSYAAPDPELAGPVLDLVIQQIRTQNVDVASNLQAYSAAVDTKQRLFQKDPDSLLKIVSPIASNIRSSYGKTSKEVADILTIVKKLRGVTIPKKDKQAKAESVSQSERSYGSMTQNFSDLITTLENYGTKYNPANTNLTTISLKDKLSILTKSSTDTTSAYGQLKKGRDQRLNLYTLLTEKTQRIKEAVKAQFGTKSTEYNLIKGLKI